MGGYYLNGSIVYGRNSVKEALKAKRDISEILISKTAKGVGDILKLAREFDVLIKFVNPESLKRFNFKTQGVVALCSSIKYTDFKDVQMQIKNSDKAVFILICDKVQDPHNLGALLRTAYAVGADAIILPKRRTAPINSTVEKASAGAVNFLNIVRVANLARAINVLKESGVFVYCADGGGRSFYEVDFRGNSALVVGSEGSGVGKLIKKQCDVICGVPMVNSIDSLNVSVAGGIIMYEIFRQNIK